MAVITKVCSPAPRAEWTEIVASDSVALIEHAPIWIDAIEAATNRRDVSRLYRFSDGRRFVVPLVAAKPACAPRTGFSTGWGIGGIVGPDLDSAAVSEIARDLAAGPAVYTHIRPTPTQGTYWAGADTLAARRIARHAHVVDLTGGVDAVHGQFRKSGRRGIRRAENRGVETTLHIGGDHLDTYYRELYLPSIERWAERQREPVPLARFRASRRDPLKRLMTIANTLGSSFRLYLGWVDGQPVAGNVVLWGPHNAHATRGASNDAGRDSLASYALEWVAIKDACGEGFGSYHLGESGQNESLADYKERFGAVGIDYAEYRFERLPLLALDERLRSGVKRLIGFRDT